MFDGYCSSTSITKVAEQQRSYRLSKSTDMHFTKYTEINVKQEDFLSNKYNKSSLINTLKVKLEDNGIRTLQVESDVDVLIVNKAVEMSETTAVGIVGEKQGRFCETLFEVVRGPESSISLFKPLLHHHRNIKSR